MTHALVVGLDFSWPIVDGQRYRRRDSNPALDPQDTISGALAASLSAATAAGAWEAVAELARALTARGARTT